jgi:hypothetical protein
VRLEEGSGPEWRDSAAYAPLLDADRPLIAWEWLRRDPRYVEAAAEALPSRGGAPDPAAAQFGLVRFEPPQLGLPEARPLWTAHVYPYVLKVTRGGEGVAGDAFDLERFAPMATRVEEKHGEHLLLCDGLHAVRLDGAPGTFATGRARLRYLLDGITTAQPPLLTLRRLLALCTTGNFSRSLHPREPRARRWVLMLRAHDALADGADQREIARELLSRTAGEPRWRTREPSVRSQAQRLVRSARRFSAGGYRALLS